MVDLCPVQEASKGRDRCPGTNVMFQPLTSSRCIALCSTIGSHQYTNSDICRARSCVHDQAKCTCCQALSSALASSNAGNGSHILHNLPCKTTLLCLGMQNGRSIA
jgi:hypothetical protein